MCITHTPTHIKITPYAFFTRSSSRTPYTPHQLHQHAQTRAALSGMLNISPPQHLYLPCRQFPPHYTYPITPNSLIYPSLFSPFSPTWLSNHPKPTYNPVVPLRLHTASTTLREKFLPLLILATGSFGRKCQHNHTTSYIHKQSTAMESNRVTVFILSHYT